MKNNRTAILALILIMGVSGWFVFACTYSEAETVYAHGEFVEPLSGVSSPFAEVANVVMPCVVGVSNRANTYSIISGQTQLIEQATGSGVVITTQGHVVTNYHVVEGANDVQVLWQGQYLTAEIVGVDELTDLAVLRVTEDVALPAVLMGEPEEVRAGDWAIVIGNPLGKQFADTVTVGVVSALNRELEESSIVKMIQTDAAINPGNSGGALLNARGEVIGINSVKYADTDVEGIGYAIPMSTAAPIIKELITKEKVDASNSSYLGIGGVDVTNEVSMTYNMPTGVYVAQVFENTAAEKYGIIPGDIITKFDGKEITSMDSLTTTLQYYAAGSTVEITVMRAHNGQYQEQTLEVVLGKKN